MPLPTIIYYGVSGLPADVLDAYFCKLHLPFEQAQTMRDLLTIVRLVPRPVVVLNLPEPPDVLIRLARQLIADPSEAFPHIFILYEGEPFDAQLEAITVIAGKSKMPRLAGHVLCLVRQSRGVYN